MRRPLAVLAVALFLAGCAGDRVTLVRGELGPASYDVTFSVRGEVAIAAESIEARLDVAATPTGAMLRLSLADDDPVLAELRRDDDGSLHLESVEGVSPRSAGETDLASLVGQVDPPLAHEPVRIGDSWSSVRRIETETVRAELRTVLELTRFSRVGGNDSAILVGTVTGALRTTTPSGTFEGRVDGDTEIAWAVDRGRLAASETTLRWRIEGAGEVEIRTTVEPA